MQFDVGPPTLVTGLVTKGRGDGGKKHWVTRFRISYSNDTKVWFYYKDASHLDVKVSMRGDLEESMPLISLSVTRLRGVHVTKLSLCY